MNCRGILFNNAYCDCYWFLWKSSPSAELFAERTKSFFLIFQHGGHWHRWIFTSKDCLSIFWVRQLSQLDSGSSSSSRQLCVSLKILPTKQGQGPSKEQQFWAKVSWMSLHELERIIKAGEAPDKITQLSVSGNTGPGSETTHHTTHTIPNR